MKRGRSASRFSPGRTAVGAVLGLGAAACTERDRLTYPSSGPGDAGPRTVIESPSTDTTVQAGPGFFVFGHSKDPDGLDTVYFETLGGVSNFPPFVARQDSVRFGIPITTSGLSGSVITVQVFATDQRGNRGDTAVRVLTVQ
jgi:hypothetical protein